MALELYRKKRKFGITAENRRSFEGGGFRHRGEGRQEAGGEEAEKEGGSWMGADQQLPRPLSAAAQRREAARRKSSASCDAWSNFPLTPAGLPCLRPWPSGGSDPMILATADR